MSRAIVAHIQNIDLPHMQKHILIAMADFVGRKGICYASIAKIASKVGCCARTVQTHLKALCDKGLVSKTVRQGMTTIYKLANMAELDPMVKAKPKPPPDKKICPKTTPANPAPTPANPAPKQTDMVCTNLEPLSCSKQDETTVETPSAEAKKTDEQDKKTEGANEQPAKEKQSVVATLGASQQITFFALMKKAAAKVSQTDKENGNIGQSDETSESYVPGSYQGIPLTGAIPPNFDYWSDRKRWYDTEDRKHRQSQGRTISAEQAKVLESQGLDVVALGYKVRDDA